MPIDEAKNLFRSDLQEAETALNEFLAANSIQLEQNQFDALISFTHQYGKDRWKQEKNYPNLYAMVEVSMIRTR